MLKALALSPEVSTAPPKPSALSIKEMYDPRNFQYGKDPLPPNELTIRPDVAFKYHSQFCNLCSNAPSPHPTCYFFNMHKTLTNGVIPFQIKPGHPTAKYTCPPLTNKHPFFDVTKSLIHKYIDANVLAPIPDEALTSSDSLVFTPVNVVFKKSELYRAKFYTSTKVTNSTSLVYVNYLLVSNSQPPVKGRAVFDHSGTGWNDLLLATPFSNASIHDGLAIIPQGATIAISDISGYYGAFAIANEARHLCAISFQEKLYWATKITFGIRSAPVFCATWAAEIRSWLSSMGIPSNVMTDDWLVADLIPANCLHHINTLKRILTELGFSIAEDKDQLGTCVTYLGIQIDTERMVISFSPIKAGSYANVLSSILHKLNSPTIANQPSISELNSVAGKLNDFANVLMAGRLRIRACWKYISERKSPSFQLDSSPSLPTLKSDIKWWLNVLAKWASNDLNGNEFPILNGDIFAKHPDKIVVFQSDASGTDGLGFLCGYLTDTDVEYRSERWLANFLYISSHKIEIDAFLRALELKLASFPKGSLIIWFTDSASATWSLNKGYCSSADSFPSLDKIFSLLDAHKCSCVAIFIPRTQNTAADFLTHYFKFFNRAYLSGSTSDEDFIRDFNCFERKGFCEVQAEDRRQICSVLPLPSPTTLPSQATNAESLPSQLHGRQQRLDQIPSPTDGPSQILLHSPPHSLARHVRFSEPEGMDRSSPIPRLHSYKPEGPAHSRNPLPNDSSSVSLSPRHNDEIPSLDESRWPSPSWRISSQPFCSEYNLEQSPNSLRPPTLSLQVSQERRPSNDSLLPPPGPLRCQIHEGAL